jgi:phosphoglycerate dehydrogenase-like enzyme
VKLLIKKTDDDGRLGKVPDYLTTDWTIEVVDEQDRQQFSRALEDADAIISMNWPAGMPPAPQLKLLHLPGAGTDAVNFDAVPQTAMVCNVYEHETGIAEYVFAAMLQWVIPMPALDQSLRHGEWQGSHLYGPVHGELFGKTLGIVGYGRIGREVAQRATAFGMRVLACSHTVRNGDRFVDSVESMSGLDALLCKSDFVLLALPLNEVTRSVIDTRRLALMQPTAVIINVARGALIDEEALFTACRDRKIGGAIIDTWYRYPESPDERCQPSRFAFETLDNIIMTPHASAWTDRLAPRRNRVIAQNLDRLSRDDPLVNVVHKALDPAPLQRTDCLQD